jgi:sugar O-acyltransferase (sialic acid O-acetyltransferase NeuD family)
MKKLAILGAGGHAKVVADAAILAGWKQIVFFDDNWPQRAQVSHWDVSGNTDMCLNAGEDFDGIIVAIGNNAVRWEKINLILSKKLPLSTIIHPAATVSQFSQIGAGSVVFAQAVVNPDSEIGLGVIINTGAIVEHDCKLGSAVHVCPGVSLAGNVTIGNYTWVGIGSTVRQGITLGADVFVAAGAVVVSNFPDHSTVMGVPAKLYCKEELSC